MFEVGFQEIVLIALLALIVLGPEKLPKLAAQLGRWTGRARAMARNLRQQLEQEVSYDDLLKEKQAAEEALRKATSAPMDFHIDDPLAPAPVVTTTDSAATTATPTQATDASPNHSLESPTSSTPATAVPAHEVADAPKDTHK